MLRQFLMTSVMALAGLGLAAPVLAQDGPLRIEITDGVIEPMPFAIARFHDEGGAGEYLAQVQELGMSALVEAHTAGEVQQALAAGAEIIGVNNRNLKDFSVNPVNSLRLRDAIPASKIFVAESGIKCAADTQALKQAGVQAVLVGEALMRSADAAAMLKEMRDA